MENIASLKTKLLELAPEHRRRGFYGLGIKMGPLRAFALSLKNEPIDWSGFVFGDIYELTLLYGLIQAHAHMSLEAKIGFFESYFTQAQDWSFVDAVVVTMPIPELDRLIAILPRLAHSPYPYVRRFAFVLALAHIVKSGPVALVFDLIDGQEPVYHVYMALAWFLAECYIKRRAELAAYLDKGTLSLTIRRRMVSKIRDSFRVSQADKDWALRYRQ